MPWKIEIPDLLCSFLPHRRLLLIVGANFSNFWISPEFSLHSRRLLPKL
ncbi:hypothetical protein SLEP1_g26350 [Rubroshorea leprosula]|uniref:Uncharacterized protein n=1 Tax=Rubroshorea leprosula TaxID=152421 RepID=A0AAV5JST8_9ROSI|nr:hypothetical protein SLEP1_g26350 [Rubroshorea leprosula]